MRRVRVLRRSRKFNEFGDTLDFGEDWADQVIGDVNECPGYADDRPAPAAAQPGGDAP